MKDYTQIGELAKFMIEAIAMNPGNIGEDGINWDFVSSDVYLDYEGVFDEQMINEAIDLIYEAAETEGEGKKVLH